MDTTMTRRRPFRAVIYLPGHDENGHGVVVAKTSTTTEDMLEAAVKPWVDQGYVVKRYEVLDMLTLLAEDDDTD